MTRDAITPAKLIIGSVTARRGTDSGRFIGASGERGALPSQAP